MAFCCADLIYFPLIGPSSAALARRIFRNSAYIDYSSILLRASWHSCIVKLCCLPLALTHSFLMKDHVIYIFTLEGMTSCLVRGNYIISVHKSWIYFHYIQLVLLLCQILVDLLSLFLLIPLFCTFFFFFFHQRDWNKAAVATWVLSIQLS